MNIDQRMREMDDRAESVIHKGELLKEELATFKAELAALKAEVAKPVEKELQPGEIVVVWVGHKEDNFPIFREFVKYGDGLVWCKNSLFGTGLAHWDHARRPTLADWRKLGAPVLDIDRLWRENPDAKIITQDGNGRMDKWEDAPLKKMVDNALWAFGISRGRVENAYPDWETRIWHRPEGV